MTDEAYAEIRRRFTVAPEKIFAAFSEPELVARWLSPSPEITLTVLRFDFRIGGRYRFAYHLPEGHTVIVGGVYRSILRPSTIAFSWIIEPPDEHAGIESEVTVTITAMSDGTELHIRHAKWTRDDATQRHSEGWRGAMDQLARLLEPEKDT